MDYTKLIAEETSIDYKYVKNTLELFANEATIPFISRYRKEQTGSLNEVQLFEIKRKYDYFEELEDRKATVLRRIATQKKLTDEIKENIEKAVDKNVLNDIYEPFRIKKQTKAVVALEKGLGPLAELFDKQESADLESLATPYISEEKKVSTVESAIKGAMDILAERVSHNFEWKLHIREKEAKHAVIFSEEKKPSKSTKKPTEKKLGSKKSDPKKASKFSMYFNFSEKVSTIPSHRILAIKRGEKEGVLKTSFKLDDEVNLAYLKNRYLSEGMKSNPHYNEMIEDAYQRLMKHSLELDLKNQLKEKADREAFTVFQKNLNNILLSSPAEDKVILGVDPGFKSGTKLAIIEKTGKHLEHRTIYPVPPQNEKDASKTIILAMIEKFKVDIVAIGNGTASREVDEFIGECLVELDKPPIKMIVSESGASVYSASPEARHEFPELDVTIRSAISIARRVQDPLAELVKIDPKSIGVGQYQHDVDQKELMVRLGHTVESCVNLVGVELNTASESLLKHVSGINKALAKAIILYRNKHGEFKSRASMVKVPQFGPKAFEQAAGFLRVRKSENILDMTAVHPESYGIVSEICDKEKVALNDLVGKPEKVDKIDFEKFITPIVGLPTLLDIKNELKRPNRKARKEFVYAQFNPEVKKIEDLKKGNWIEGVVTNVTDFGVFLDLGVHQDGMIHVSELGKSFVKSVADSFQNGMILKVRILDVDVQKKRISLSLRKPGSPGAQKKGGFKKKHKPAPTVNSLKKRFSQNSKEKQNNVKLKFSVKSIMKAGR